MTEQTTKDITKLIGLAEAQRLEARDLARDNMLRRIGPAPRREQYDHHASASHPAYVTKSVLVLTLILLAAFFAISSQRIFSIASIEFGRTIDYLPSRVIAGLAVVIGSEVGALVFMLAAGVLAESRAQKAIFYGLAFASTALALVGNVQFSLGANWTSAPIHNPMAFLESIIPPLTVLGGALVIERVWLSDIRRRHANERAYLADLADWQERTAEPEQHPNWRAVYMNALRSKLIEVNSSGRGQQERRDLMAQLQPGDWRALVLRELHADDWTEAQIHDQPVATMAAPQTPAAETDQPIPFGLLSSTNGKNGHSQS